MGETMSLLSSLFSSAKKTNLTPDVGVKMPSQINPDMYANLSTLAKNYQNGVGTGFGADYVDKTTNPVAASMRRNYQNVTAPTINSNYSSRGLGQSSLAANAQGLAEGNVESDIGSLMAQFYQLNEAQKKTDQNTGINLGQNILSGDINQANNQASASERLANATSANSIQRQGMDTATAKNIANTAGQLGGQLFSMGQVGSPAQANPFVGNQPGVGATSTYGAGNIPQGMPLQTNIAGVGSNAKIQSLLKLFGL